MWCCGLFSTWSQRCCCWLLKLQYNTVEQTWKLQREAKWENSPATKGKKMPRMKICSHAAKYRKFCWLLEYGVCVFVECFALVFQRLLALLQWIFGWKSSPRPFQHTTRNLHLRVVSQKGKTLHTLNRLLQWKTARRVNLNKHRQKFRGRGNLALLIVKSCHGEISSKEGTLNVVVRFAFDFQVQRC